MAEYIPRTESRYFIIVLVKSTKYYSRGGLTDDDSQNVSSLHDDKVGRQGVIQPRQIITTNQG